MHSIFAYDEYDTNAVDGEFEGELHKFITTYKSSFSANIRVSLISLPDDFSPAPKILLLKPLTFSNQETL